MWGTSYLLHDAQPARLVGGLGSSTDRVGNGTIRISFTQEPGVVAATHKEATWELVIKWDVALRLMALVQVLILQNQLLRNELPRIGLEVSHTRLFDVTGGARMSPLVCSWDAATTEIQCGVVPDGMVEQFELVMTEGAATQLVMLLAERVALNGIANARKKRATE